jgi:hypothetical protein
LAAPAGAPALDAARRAAHERDVVTTVDGTVDDRARGAAGVAVSADVSITLSDATSVSAASARHLDLWVVVTPAGWRVAGVEL